MALAWPPPQSGRPFTSSATRAAEGLSHARKPVRLAPITPVQACVVQQARNLLMDLEDAGTRVKLVLHDRCYRPRYLTIQRLTNLRAIRRSSARIADNAIA